MFFRRKRRTSALARANHTHRSRRSKQTFEVLEPRQLMAGDFANAVIDDATMNTLLTGLDDFAAWGSEISQTGDFNVPLALVTEPDGSEVTVGQLFDFGESLQGNLADPIRENLEAADPASRDTDSLADYLGSLPHVTVDGGLTSNPTNELRFEVAFSDQTSVSQLGIDLGANGAALGLSIDETIDADLLVTVTYQITFGVDLNTDLSTEQAFFLRDTSFGISVDLHDIDQTTTATIGFLEAPSTSISTNINLDMTLNLNDVVPDPDENVTLAEINGYAVAEVADTSVDVDSATASIVTTPSIGTWTAPGIPTVTVTGHALTEVAPEVTTNADFAELLQFTHLDADQVMAGLNSLETWLDQFNASSIFRTDLPFAGDATLGTAFDIARAFRESIGPATDDGNQPSFGTLQQFADALNLTTDYDDTTNELTFSFNILAQTQESVHDLQIDSGVANLTGLSAGDAVQKVTGNGSLEFDLKVDLSHASPNIDDQFAVADLTINGDIGQTASNIAGTATHGFVGLEFNGGSIDGASHYIATVVDPQTGDARASLGSLYAGLVDPVTLLASPLELSGLSTFDLGDLSVQDDLFPLTESSLTISQEDFLPAEISSTVDPMLTSLVSIDAQYLANSVSDAIAVAAGFADSSHWGEFMGALPIDSDTPYFDLGESEPLEPVDDEPLLLQQLSESLENIEIMQHLNAHVETTIEALGHAVTLSVQLIENAKSIPVEIGLQLSEVVNGIGEFAGASDVVDAQVGAEMNLDVLVDVSDPENPLSYLLDSTNVTTNVYINETNTSSMVGAIGLLGAEFDDGTIVVAADRAAPDPNHGATFTVRPEETSDGKYLLEDADDVPVTTSAQGEAKADYQFTKTGDLLPQPDRFVFNVDMVGATSTATPIETPPFQDLVNGVDTSTDLSSVPSSLLSILNVLTNSANSGFFGLGFPIIGQGLSGDGNFLQDIYDKLASAFSGVSIFDPTTMEDELETLLESLFGKKVKDDGEEDDGFIDIDLSDLTDIRITFDLSDAIFEKTKSFDTDLGLPALGASLNTDVQLVGSYDTIFTFGVSLEPGIGVYLDTTNEKFGVGLDVNLIPEPDEPVFQGRLGFLEVNVDAVATCPSNQNQDDCVPVDTIFHGEFVVDITEPSGDGRLTLQEAFDSVADLSVIDFDNSGLMGGTGAEAGDVIELEFEAAVAEWLPSLNATLEIDWQFSGLSLRGDTPTVRYRDVQIDLDGFVEKTFSPLLVATHNFLQPITPVLDALETPIPIVSDVLGDTTILEGAMAVVDAAPDDFVLAQRVDRVVGFSNFLSALQRLSESVVDGNGAKIDIGDIEFGPHNGFHADLQEFGAEWLAEVGLDADDPWAQIEAEAQELAEDLAAAGETFQLSGGELDFPIFDEPLSVFEWLLGIRHIDIVTMKVAELAIELPLDLVFPIVPGVNVGLLGGLNVDAGISIGIDTYGIEEFSKTKQAGDLFQSFYISDTKNADGSGKDEPEIAIGGDLPLGLALGVKEFSAEVAGGLYADVELDLIDDDNDGKVRGHELMSETGCMEISGSIDFAAEVTLGSLDAFPFASHELASFNEVVHCVRYPKNEHTLARRDPLTGELTLLVGQRAAERSLLPDEVNEFFEVTQANGEILVHAFGATQSFAESQVTRIIAHADSGFDKIILDASVNKPALLTGGDDDDILQGGSAADIIDGGNGDDDLFGGAEADTITTGPGQNNVYGEAGRDVITGGPERDVIEGGDDGDTIDGGAGDDVIYGQGGGDTLLGGPGEDFVDGGSEGDRIEGNEDADDLYGGEGDDSISGDDGDDVIFGEGGDDTLLAGGLGDDHIDGGVGGDTIDGGEGEDQLFGGDGDDHIDGGTEDDVISGGNDDDVISGGDGEDSLFGDQGIDTIRGLDGIDTIEGGPDGDFLYGGHANDVIRGGDGNDVIEGESGDDEIYGDSGSDRIHGNSASFIGPVTSDRDTIFGGSGGDQLFGDSDEDVIYGEGGRDQIRGGPEDDEVFGGNGDDRIVGDAGDDQLYGEAGDDTIDGGAGQDTMRGQDGDDYLLGNSGHDDMFGDDGNDRAEGGAGDDLIEGGTGDDHLAGNDDADEIYGGLDNDTLLGGSGNDIIRGNSGVDVLYGDDDQDDLAGGPDNDTMRGGGDVDTMRGGDGDDLMLGNAGDDEMWGDAGNDVLRGNLGNDSMSGDTGDDRVLGDDGDDTILGDSGNDILAGGPGNDLLEGDIGNDQLHGDGGTDILDGGPDDDVLWAGDGIGNQLLGGDGDDEIVGSDDGRDDANLFDAVYFGDVIFGGPGNDIIDALGGADLVDGGVGEDVLRGGTHGDLLIGGPEDASGHADRDVIFGQLGDDTIRGGADDDELAGGLGTNTIDGGQGSNTVDSNGTAPSPEFSLSSGSGAGAAGTGNWASLSGSAGENGLSQVGGLEEAVYAADGGTYVAWVDTRNGNSEIYLAFHPGGEDQWIEISGSASGGGISDDAHQSRRPSIAKADDQLLISWTSIDEAGNSNIEIAQYVLSTFTWSRIPNPGQTGSADHSQLATYANGALLAWIDAEHSVEVAQFVSCANAFLPTTTTVYENNQILVPLAGVPREIDLAADGPRAAITWSKGTWTHEVEVALATSNSLVVQCGGQNVTILTPDWSPVGTFDAGDNTHPAVAVRVVDRRTLGANETEFMTDVYVAWQSETDREDQVVAKVLRQEFDGRTGEWENMVPEFAGQTILRSTNSVSETIGYAGQPDLAASDSEVFLAWLDDGVHQADGDNRSSIYVMSAVGDDRVLREIHDGDASGDGISETGGALQSLSIAVDPVDVENSRPYVAWTDAQTERPQVYLRHDQNVAVPKAILRESEGRTTTSESGRTDTYDVFLSSRPDSDVTITLHIDNQVSTSTAAITFSPDNWFISRTVTIRATDDADVERNHTSTIKHTVTSADPSYNGLVVSDVQVRISDNDFAINPIDPVDPNDPILGRRNRGQSDELGL